MKEISSKSASGAGASEQSSRRTSRSVLPRTRDMRGADHGDDLIDEAEIILGEDAEGFAGLVVEPASERSNSTCQVAFSDPSLFRRRRDKNAAVVGASRERPGCALRGTASGLASAKAGVGDRGLSISSTSVFQHARGFLAAGRAEIEPLLLREAMALRIILAIIAALAAILLRHRGHHAPPQRTAFRELHALGKRKRLIVPGRFAIVAICR